MKLITEGDYFGKRGNWKRSGGCQLRGWTERCSEGKLKKYRSLEQGSEGSQKIEGKCGGWKVGDWDTASGP